MEDTTRSIYILRLEKNKYYIGTTKNVLRRITEHSNGNGAQYTKKYKPVEIEAVHHGCDSYDEDKFVIKYMAKYGINNVRGGSYCSFTLDTNIIRDIEMRIGTATDICFLCGSTKHFARDCPIKQLRELSSVNKPVEYCHNCNSIDHKSYECPSDVICKKCNKTGHKAFECTIDNYQASSQAVSLVNATQKFTEPIITVNKYKIGVDSNISSTSDSTLCYKCNNHGHKSFECPENLCFKCNKSGHLASNCPIGDVCYKCNQVGHRSFDCKS